MNRREFKYEYGLSNKFWTIELNGASHTVLYGRAGTEGQTQTRTFDSEAEAKKSYDKLIALKLKKKYAERISGKKGGSSAIAAECIEASANSEVSPVEAAGPLSAGSMPLNAARRLDLPPGAMHWRDELYAIPEPEPKPLAQPFDLKSSLRRLCLRDADDRRWLWETNLFPRAMTPAEAHFWLEAIFVAPLSPAFDNGAKTVAKALGEMRFTGEITLKQFVERFEASDDPWSGYYKAYPLHFLFSPTEMVEFYAKPWALNTGLVEVFAGRILPYLTVTEREHYRALLRRHVTPRNWPRDDSEVPAAFTIAIWLGMHDELREVVLSWPNNAWGDPDAGKLDEMLVYTSPDDAFIAEQIRRLGIPICGEDELRQWIAVSGCAGLDAAKSMVLDCGNKSEATAYIGIMGCVKAPETAPHMLELSVSSKAPKAAKAWLDKNPAWSIPGVMPLAEEKSKLADAAIDFLQDARRHGHEAAIRQALKSVPAARERVSRDVLGAAEQTYEPLDTGNTPKALAAAFAAAPVNKKPLIGLDLALLPPVVVGEGRLNDEQVTALLTAMRNGRNGSVLLKAVEQHATRDSLDAFLWYVFEGWLRDGAAPADKWKMISLGLAGSDTVAMKLTPLIRQWPGESQHARAVAGLECLRAIGSDTALMCLNAIAQKPKFKGLKAKAVELMGAIAKDRGMGRIEMEDRIVPDCGLDQHGSMVFDFGPRQFRFVLGPDMKPMVKDAQNKVRAQLPPPGPKDDPAKAGKSAAAWKLLTKQVKEVARLQAERLEEAMVTSRRWSVQEFETLLVRHPLMINLVRLLLWGGFDKGKLVATFRVTEDRKFADQKDDDFDPSRLTQVGIVHPMNLDAASRAAWGEMFSEYELIAPFPQLSRPVYILTTTEAKASEITRFNKEKVPAITLVGILERLAWARGVMQDVGTFHEHTKPFPVANVTAVIQYDGISIRYMAGNKEQTVATCFFVPGMYEPTLNSKHKKRARLGDVDPVVVSEVLKDLTLIASKAK